MGGALWVFLWLWQEGQPGESPYVRQVRGGGSFRSEEIGQALGLNERTVRRHLITLSAAGYLTTWREPHGFSAVVSIWESEKAPQGERPDNSVRSEITAERPDKVVRSLGPDRTTLSDHQLRPDRVVRSENPPAPPLRVLEESSLDSSSSGGFLEVPTTAKRAQVVPLRGGLEAAAPRPVAVAAGPSPGRLRQEQAIAHLIGRIEAWERPELTRTLLDNLCQVSLSQLPLVFEQVWRFHRTRRKDLDNPAGWWAAMLARAVQECRRNMKGAHDYG
ncbi:MAG: hypothetical protein HY910_07285 [Desulfarculus sp.]|nr:hypothetical protein [Desulfarculus sp.]